MNLFNLKKTTKTGQCEAMRCTANASCTVPGDLWSKSATSLCDKHTEAVLQFAEANPGYQPSAAALVKGDDYLAGIVVPDSWAQNAYNFVTSVMASEAEAKDTLALVQGLTIQSHDDMASVADVLRDVKTKRNEIETGDKNTTGPLVAIVKRVRALIAPAKQTWTDAESKLRQLLNDAAVAEAKRNQQLVLEAADAHAQGADVTEHLAQMTTSTDLEGVSVRLVWVAVVDDLGQLPDEYVIRQPDLKKLGDYAKSFEGGEPDPVPGVRFLQQAPLRVTGK